jgi:hypothetical protein
LGKEGEFGASIRDAEFLDNVLRGRSAIPMVAGIRMEVELLTIEDPFEGAWIVRERNILNVRRVIPPSIQPGLGSGAQDQHLTTQHARQPPRSGTKDN